MGACARKTATGGNSSLPLFLSLFLLLLAFFILLNSVTDKEGNRSDIVVESVRRAFQEDLGGLLDTGALEDPGSTGLGEKVRAGLKDAFEKALPLTRDVKIVRDDPFTIEIPVKHLFASGGVVPTGTATDLAQRLVPILMTPDAKRTISTEILFRYDDKEGFGGALARRVPILQAARFADLLERTGLPDRHQAIGLEEGRLGIVRFVFDIVSGLPDESGDT